MVKNCLSFRYEKLITFYFLYGKLGHEESFYPIRMVHGRKELSFGWDISLKVIPRKEAIGGSIQLKDAGGNQESNFGNNDKGKGRILGDHSIPNFMGKVGVNLGINLAGQSNMDMEGNLIDLVDMDSLEEERPFITINGKKKPQNKLCFASSISKDSSETI